MGVVGRIWYFAAALAVVALIALILIGRTHPSEHELTGTYILSYDTSRETLMIVSLKLLPSGAYVEKITEDALDGNTPDRIIANRTGAWSYDSNDNSLALRGALTIVDPNGEMRSDFRMQRSDVWVLHPEMNRLASYIAIDPRARHFFVKE
ncbi:MAG TPA: hypothetical protein VK216_04590 [Magnetospirillaceae bacterium]|nr:hypothetical protein [Magnetospirillaceae bacterium]